MTEGFGWQTLEMQLAGQRLAGKQVQTSHISHQPISQACQGQMIAISHTGGCQTLQRSSS